MLAHKKVLVDHFHTMFIPGIGVEGGLLSTIPGFLFGLILTSLLQLHGNVLRFILYGIAAISFGCGYQIQKIFDKKVYQKRRNLFYKLNAELNEFALIVTPSYEMIQTLQDEIDSIIPKASQQLLTLQEQKYDLEESKGKIENNIQNPIVNLQQGDIKIETNGKQKIRIIKR